MTARSPFVATNPRLGRIVKALRLAATYAIPTHFGDHLRHCGEASIAGAEVLRRRGLRARVLPCAVVGTAQARGVGFSVGLNGRELYNLQVAMGEPMPPYEVWREEMASRCPPDDDLVFHACIEASLGRHRAFIDLTAGQLRQDYGVAVPMTLAFFGQGWPAASVDDWTFTYTKSPRQAKVSAFLEGKSQKGLADDLDALLDVALAADLNEDAMWAVLMATQREMVRLLMRRLEGFMARDEQSGLES